MSGGAGESRDPGLPYVNLDEADERPPKPGRAGAAVKPEPPRAPTAITVEIGAHDTFRGDTVEVNGVVRAEDPGSLPVEIFLAGPPGALRVGAATTNPDGSFRALIDIPRNLPLGDHRVVARTRGDARRGPSRSR